MQRTALPTETNFGPVESEEHVRRKNEYKAFQRTEYGLGGLLAIQQRQAKRA